jgi:hypothetical protein
VTDELEMVLENKKAIIAGLPKLLPVLSDFVFKTTMSDPESDASLCDLVESSINIGVTSATLINNETNVCSSEDKRLRLDGKPLIIRCLECVKNRGIFKPRKRGRTYTLILS